MGEKKASSVLARRNIADVDPFFRDFFDSSARWPSLFRSVGAEPVARWAPAMDLTETEEGYAIAVELPGTKAEDVDVEYHENLLTVKGQKRSEREEKDEHHHYKERTFGSFSRTVRLPPDAAEDVKARFADGVLTIEVPKEEQTKPRVVAIDSK